MESGGFRVSLRKLLRRPNMDVYTPVAEPAQKAILSEARILCPVRYYFTSPLGYPLGEIPEVR